MRSIQFALTIIALFACTVMSYGQKEETILGSRGLRLSGLWGGPKTQITKFGNSNSLVAGGNFGLEFGNALFIGYGNYRITNDIKWDNIATQDFNFRWGGPIIGYGINNLKRIHPVFTVQAGQGNVWFNEFAKDRILVVQPAAGIELNVLRWLHIGVDGGYRFVSDSSISGLTDNQLSGAFGQISIKFGYSWTNLRNTKRWKKSQEQKG
jgi:hypothetical protein